MIVTIDGPAGAGKSSTAKALAQRLGFEYLDTGAMYRAVAVVVLRANLELDREDRLSLLLDKLHLEMPPARVLVDREDITGSIRAPQVSEVASQLAAMAVVRRHLVRLQREIAAGRNMVCEGRDQGTVAFPDAARKFFVIADAHERARRRLRDLQARGETTTLAAVLEAQRIRDARDASRDLAPMVPAADAIVLDTTFMTLEQVVERMEHEVRRCPTGFPGASSKPSSAPSSP